jgi:hypothetical protein
MWALTEAADSARMKLRQRSAEPEAWPALFRQTLLGGLSGAHSFLTEAGAAVIHARRQPRNRSMDAGTYGAGQSKPSGWSGVSFLAPHSMPTWPSPDGVA